MTKNRLAILGGGKREVIVANELIKDGYSLQVYGLPAARLQDPAVSCDSVRSALRGAQAVILPVAGIDRDGKLSAPYWQEPVYVGSDDFSSLPSGTPIFCGGVSPYLSELAEEAGLELVRMMGREDVAVANAIPTAEGAVEIAIRETPCTIDGSLALVCGYGRVGKAMAKLLAAMGAKVTVFSRNQEEHQQGRREGFDMRYYAAFERMLARADMLFNSVPAMILDRELLIKARKEIVLIDLASQPGGIDFQAAASLGIKTIHALGLPEKCAPVTAGEILANAYKTILPDYFLT